MNIYFECSITGGRADEPIYQQIVATLQADGHEVPTALLAGSDVIHLEMIVDPVDVFSRDTGWIDDCDLLVAEVSTPSHGVGFEICYALQQSKPVLCLHHEGTPVSKMITGNREPNLTVLAYTEINDVVTQLRDYLLSLSLE
jgi:2'-deoxynucleoside 5'-phosphate N-hydrolase